MSLNLNTNLANTIQSEMEYTNVNAINYEMIYTLLGDNNCLDYKFETLCKMPKFVIIGWQKYKFVVLIGNVFIC